MTEPMDVRAGLEVGAPKLAQRWREERSERLARRHLDQVDFDELASIGWLVACVPADLGGVWVDQASSTRLVSETLRTLAGGDPAVALVSAMHPAVLGYWLNAPPVDDAPWIVQFDGVLQSAIDGVQWGTITSEPGSGGDIARTFEHQDHMQDDE